MAEQNADMIKITTSAYRAVNPNEKSVWKQTGRRPHPADGIKVEKCGRKTKKKRGW